MHLCVYILSLRYRPAFSKEGFMTAANSSKLSDGAAAMVLHTTYIVHTILPLYYTSNIIYSTLNNHQSILNHTLAGNYESPES